MNIKRTLAAVMATACITNACFCGGVNLSVNAEDGETTENGNTTLDTAIEVVYDTTYEETIEYEKTEYFKFTLPESGRVTLTFSSHSKVLDYSIWTEDLATKITKDSFWYKDELGLNYNVINLDLTGGTYYFTLTGPSYSQSSDYYGAYTVKMDYEACEESFAETGNGNNNNALVASPIEFETEFSGQLALNDAVDYYSFTLLETQNFICNIQSEIKKGKFQICDMDGKLYHTSELQTGDEELVIGNFDVVLDAGEYFIKVSSVDNSWTGNYTFATNIASLYEKGDVNRDKTINLYDVIEVAKYIMNMTTLDDEQLTIGDMNIDNTVNLYDAVEIAKIIMNS